MQFADHLVCWFRQEQKQRFSYVGVLRDLEFPHCVEPEAFCACWKIWLLHPPWEIRSGISCDPNFGALVILKLCNKINVEIILCTRQEGTLECSVIILVYILNVCIDFMGCCNCLWRIDWQLWILLVFFFTDKIQSWEVHLWTFLV